MYTKNKH